MVQRHHVYFLLYPPPPIAGMAARLLHDPRVRRQAAGGAPMPEDRLHVTLHCVGQFEGDVSNQDVDRALAVGAAVSDEPFDVAFDRLESSKTRVGPLGLAGRGPVMRKLRSFQRGLGDTMNRMGCRADQIRTNFSPHITLDYAHQPVGRQAVGPIAWRVTEFFLVVSHYGQARHEVLARWPLTARQQEFSAW